MSDNPTDSSRRDLLKGAALAGAGLAFGLTPNAAAAQPAHVEPTELPLPASAAATMAGVPFERRDTVRVAIVGTGLRGRSVLHELLGVGNVRITALCDTVPDKVEMAVQQMQKAGHDYQPARFTQGERDYERLVQQGDIDLVYTATPWQYHVPVVLAAMNAGKHAATEVPAAYTLEECWKLVETSERTRRHCIMMENCNYGYNELLVLNMVRSGALGYQTCRCSVQPRSARDSVREQGRGIVAPSASHAAQRQPVSHAWAGAGSDDARHQPWRPLRLFGVHEHAGVWAFPVARGA